MLLAFIFDASWYNSVTTASKSNAILNAVLQDIQLEQAKTESLLICLDAAEVFKKEFKIW